MPRDGGAGNAYLRGLAVHSLLGWLLEHCHSMVYSPCPSGLSTSSSCSVSNSNCFYCQDDGNGDL
jgi:hypothetical protein